MFPCTTIPDVVHIGCASTELFADIGSRARTSTNLPNLIFRQLCQATAFAFCMAALSNAISPILRIGPDKHMIGIYAIRIVACMQQLLASRDSTDKDLINHSVSALMALEFRTPDMPVVLLVRPAQPKPAARIRLRHKLAFNSGWQLGHAASSIAPPGISMPGGGVLVGLMPGGGAADIPPPFCAFIAMVAMPAGTILAPSALPNIGVRAR